MTVTFVIIYDFTIMSLLVAVLLGCNVFGTPAVYKSFFSTLTINCLCKNKHFMLVP